MKRGFTLIELIIVVIIIGILATVAVPQYLKAVERAKGGKARFALGLIGQGEKMYRADNDTYIDVAMQSFDATLGEYVEMAEIDADLDWTYEVTDSDPTLFTATATRQGGPNDQETLTLDQSGMWGGTFTP